MASNVRAKRPGTALAVAGPVDRVARPHLVQVASLRLARFLVIWALYALAYSTACRCNFTCSSEHRKSEKNVRASDIDLGV